MDIAVKRIYDDVTQGKRTEENSTSIIESIVSIQKQTESAQERYFRDYGIDIRNTSVFDLIIDTDNKTPDEVVALIRKRYKEWQNSS